MKILPRNYGLIKVGFKFICTTEGHYEGEIFEIYQIDEYNTCYYKSFRNLEWKDDKEVLIYALNDGTIKQVT